MLISFSFRFHHFDFFHSPRPLLRRHWKTCKFLTYFTFHSRVHFISFSLSLCFGFQFFCFVFSFFFFCLDISHATHKGSKISPRSLCQQCHNASNSQWNDTLLLPNLGLGRDVRCVCIAIPTRFSHPNIRQSRDVDYTVLECELISHSTRHRQRQVNERLQTRLKTQQCDVHICIFTLALFCCSNFEQ